MALSSESTSENLRFSLVLPCPNFVLRKWILWQDEMALTIKTQVLPMNPYVTRWDPHPHTFLENPCEALRTVSPLLSSQLMAAHYSPPNSSPSPSYTPNPYLSCIQHDPAWMKYGWSWSQSCCGGELHPDDSLLRDCSWEHTEQ